MPSLSANSWFGILLTVVRWKWLCTSPRAPPSFILCPRQYQDAPRYNLPALAVCPEKYSFPGLGPGAPVVHKAEGWEEKWTVGDRGSLCGWNRLLFPGWWWWDCAGLIFQLRYTFHTVRCTGLKCIVHSILSDINIRATHTLIEIKSSPTQAIALCPFHLNQSSHPLPVYHRSFVFVQSSAPPEGSRAVCRLRAWLLLPSMSEIQPSCCVRPQLIPFYCWVVFHCVRGPQVVYPFFCWWTLCCFQIWLLWIKLLWPFFYRFSIFVWTHRVGQK